MKQFRTYGALVVIAFLLGERRGYARGRMWMLEHLAHMSRARS